MSDTVIITGASKGIGRATAIHFAEKGWNVIATMRNPDHRQTDLKGRERIEVCHLDVTEPESIRSAMTTARDRFGKINAVVNNAGYPVLGPFELVSEEQVRRQFDTNVFGLMAVMRESIPILREQGGGTIVNVASIGGRVTFPLYSVYNSTKWAVEGFSEGVQWELRDQNIRIKIIEPGIIKTEFYGSSEDKSQGKGHGAYGDFVPGVMRAIRRNGEIGSEPEVIAKLIYKAAMDNSWKLRYHAGKNAGTVLFMRWLLPDRPFMGLLRRFSTK